MSDHVVIGKFGRPHGVGGEVRFFAYNPETTLVSPKRVLQLDGPIGSVVVESVRAADKFFIVRLVGVDDREGADRLRNPEASVPRNELPAANDDEFYLVDVVGFDVWAAPTAGAPATKLGCVKGWLDIGPTDIMAVTGPDIRGRMLVPHIEQVVERVDFDERQVLLLPLDTWAMEDA